MKQLALILILLMVVFGLKSQTVIFLHHSTGNNVFFEGNVKSLIDSCNQFNHKNIQITERAFPNEPWPWENYPYDYWKLWVGGACNPTEKNTECLPDLASGYNLIILKHCFPGADLQPDMGQPKVNSPIKSLENYKAQYRALRAIFDSFPNTKFMVWTLTPLHRLATSPEKAARAYEFVQWVKNDWRKEDGKTHANIFVFDFFSLIAELSPNPTFGATYCLKYDFERSHTHSDSHPNKTANQFVAPLFVKAIEDALNQ